MIRITIDLRSFEEELDRIADLPDARTVAHLEAALRTAFEDTQASVHVITGSLKNSGHTESDVRDNVWEGDIIYGGPSPGFPHDPVKYAQYERNRGGDHDFFSNIHFVQSAFDHAVQAALAGDDV